MHVHNRCPGLRPDARGVQRLIHALDASGQFSVPPGELSIAILDAVGIGKVHADFLDDPTPTDVITFEGDSGFGSAGEICACAEVARDFAQTNRGNFSRELTLYITHGYLHLAGFDDTTASARRAMRRAEKIALGIATAAAAMPHFRWR